MFDLGYIRTANDWSGAYDAWVTAVEQAQRFSAVGKQITPWRALEIYAPDPSGGGGGGGVVRFTGVKEQTQTTKNVQMPTRLGLQRGLRAVFEEAVGRAPTDGEMRRYSKLLRSYAEEHPSITTAKQRTRFREGEVVDTDVTTRTRGGTDSADLAQLAQNRVEADPEYGAYQAATKYFNALIQGLAAPV